MSTEIERKFWLSERPDFLQQATPQSIQQGYLAAHTEGNEVRLRKTDDQFTMTVKSGSGLSRDEYEITLQEDQFQALWPATKGVRLRKKRYRHSLSSGLTLEIDEYEEPLRGLLIGEIEFPDEDTAEAFDPPDWLGREVTQYSLFKNKNLTRCSTVEELKAQL